MININFLKNLYKLGYKIKQSIIKNMPTDISKGLKFFEGQPLIKNSHLFTNILVYKNEQIILFSDKAFYVYSYHQMLRDEAALVNIVEYQQLFKNAQPQEKGKKIKKDPFHMDQITTIFNNPHHQQPHSQQKTFGDKIFTNPKDINTNILLQGQHFINRLTYLNSIKVKNVDISIHGDLLINFVNGQALFVRRDNSVNYYKSYSIIDLCSLTKKKVQYSKFIQGLNNLLVFYSEQKVIFFDYLRNIEIFSHKYTSLEFLNQIHAFTVKSQQGEEKVFIAFQHPQKLVFLEFNIQKKKLANSDTLDLKQNFIQKVFTYPKSNIIYICTALQLIKFDMTQLITSPQKDIQKLNAKMSRSKSKESQKSVKSVQKLQAFKYQTLSHFQNSSLQQILYLNDQGDFIPKCKNTTKQYLNLVAQTESGIFVGVTCKKQGNYKQGQLLIGIRDDYFEQMIRKCCLKITQISKYENLNFQDLTIFSTNLKLKKEFVPQLSKLFNDCFNTFSDLQSIENENQQDPKIQIEGVMTNEEQFEVLFLNLGYLFESKEAMRQKVIEKKLISQYKIKIQQNMTQNKNENIKDIKEKCIFTFKQIGNQQKILQCKKCDLYGIKHKIEDQKVWQDGLRNGNHRCTVCLNQMKCIY